MTDDGKTNTEKSGHPDSSAKSMKLPEPDQLRLDAAIREEVILFPIRVWSATECANLVTVLTLSKNAGIARTYVLFSTQEKHADRISIMLRLRAICAPLNARYSVVSSRPGRLLIYVSYCKPTIALENTPLDGG